MTVDPHSNRCPACGAALWSDGESLYGQRTCPRCGVSLVFIHVAGETRFYVRDKNHPVTRLLEDPPSGADSLDLVELVMEIEEEMNQRED